MNPLASVIVPVYNGEQFLAECLEALLAQDYRPLEVIVCDDGSTDTTPQIAARYPGIGCLRQENAGPSAARNLGIESCTGDFITFCDCDDLYYPAKVSTQVSYLQEHLDVSCVMVRHRTIVQPGTEPPGWIDRDDGGVQVQSAMVRRSVIDAVGGYNPQYRMSENMEWLTRIKTAGMVVGVIDEILVDRRLHNTNACYERKGLQRGLLATLHSRLEERRSKTGANCDQEVGP